MEFTREQQRVIEASPEHLLISAAAGSGKTTVLAERIVRRVLSGEADIRKLLVMTFTEAAAANMRRKIGDRLRVELGNAQDGAERARLSRQLSALPRASLSTIHSFGLDVFRSFQYLLQDENGQALAEPGSGVLDPAAADLLLSDALDRVLSSFYLFCDAVADGGAASAEALVPAGLPVRDLHPAPFVFGGAPETAGDWTASFQVLCDGFSPGRDDRSLRGLAVSLHRFLRSMPDYEQWAAGMVDRLSAAAADFGSSEWAETLIRQARILIDKSVSAVPRLLRQLDGGLAFVKDIKKNAAYVSGYRLLLTELNRLADSVSQGEPEGPNTGWDRLVRLASTLPEPSLSTGSRDDETADFIQEFLRYIPETIHVLTGRMGTKKYSDEFEFDTRPLFTRASSEIGADIAAMVSPMRRLMEVVLLTDRVYSALKIQERGIDFSDFEHFALRILRTDEARAYYRDRFSEVYIDECQDTSSIQDEIVASVAGDSVFMVGDVKQSIYRFRHANPTLFLERSRRFAAGEGGRLLGLNRNFRSTAGILAAVNRLFRQILSEASGEIDYDDGQALTPADGAEPGEAVRLLLVDVHQETLPEPDGENEEDEAAGHDSVEEEEPEKELLEGLAIASCIRGLLSDGVKPDDIAILGRTHRVCRTAADALGRTGIAHTLADSPGFLATPELLLMESLVGLLDNAAQDKPLAAVMRSRLHADHDRPGAGCPDGFSEAELLAIRAASDADAAGGASDGSPRLFFHQAVAWYAQNGPDPQLRTCVAGFLSWLDALRGREPYLRLSELLALVFDRSGYLEYVSQLPDGARRAEELSLFCRWAESFESGGPRGLHRFAGHLAALRKEGTEESPFAAERPVDGRVRILTIHGSKGLEFGHVFVAGCGKSLNVTSTGRLLYSERSGLGPAYVDPSRSVTYPTYARLAMENSLRNAAMAEEMRLLYVAMTRAAKRLWLTAGVDLDPEKGAPALARRICAVRRTDAGTSDLTLPAHLPLSARSFLDWILMSMARDADTDWTAIAGSSDPEGLAACPVPTAAGNDPVGRMVLEIRRRADILDGYRVSLQSSPTGTDTAADVEPRDPRGEIVDRLTGPLDLTGMDAEAYHTARARFERLLLSEYRFPAAASSAAKISVSELKRREQAYARTGDDSGEEASAEPASWLQGTGLELVGPGSSSADGEGARTLYGAERGTAIHAVLRYLDLAAAGDNPDETEILRQIRLMRACEMLTPAETASMEPLAAAFARYARSGLCRRVRVAEARGRVYREMPFTLKFDAPDIHKGRDASGFGPGDATLVQGIIDLWFEEPESGGVVLVDFKSDRIPGTAEEAGRILAERYRVQLDHYTSAIERTTEKSVVSRLVWLFDRGQAFEIGKD